MTQPDSGLLGLIQPSRWVSRSITAENPTGAKGAGGRALTGMGERPASQLGQGWKVSPCVELPAGTSLDIAAIDGPGILRHLWVTAHRSVWRALVVRMFWDDARTPAVEVPFGDFFCNGWGTFSQVSSEPIAANPNGGFNSYWPMPFRRSARISVENLSAEPVTLYYQVDYSLGEVPEDVLYFHCQWRRSRAVDNGVHTILDGIEGRGRYAGTYLAWQSNSPGWWGEGEVKFYLDGDEWPTICGTGTEDYFGGAWNFDIPGQGYTEFTTPYLGLNQVIRPDGLYASQQRFGLYRWHIQDDIAFDTDIRVTVQALGIAPAHGNGAKFRYRLLQDDIASTAVFYLNQPAATPEPRRPAPTLLDLEIA